MRDPRIAVKRGRESAIDPQHGMRYSPRVPVAPRRIELPSPERDTLRVGKLVWMITLGMLTGVGTSAVVIATSPRKTTVAARAIDPQATPAPEVVTKLAEPARSAGAPHPSNEKERANLRAVASESRTAPDANAASASRSTTTAALHTPDAGARDAALAADEPEEFALARQATQRGAAQHEHAPAKAPPAAAPTRAPAPTPAPSAARELHVEPGRIAYVACEGLPLAQGPYPCPRDAELEQRVLAIAQTLPRCERAGALGTGVLDLRLRVGATGTVEDLKIQAASPRAEATVRACVAPSLRALQSSLRPSKMIVSFRFDLR